MTVLSALLLLCLVLLPLSGWGFASPSRPFIVPSRPHLRPPTSLAVASFDQISLAASQENTGLAIVVIGEAVYSFSRAPGLFQSLILLPPLVASYFLLFVSGPILDVPSSDMSQGLLISSGVSLALIVAYVARMKLPSKSPKEYAFLGALVGFAGFCSFAQNAVAGGWVTLPHIGLPSLPQLPF